MVLIWRMFIFWIFFFLSKLNYVVNLNEISDKMNRLINKGNKAIEEYSNIPNITINATKEDYFFISQYKANYLLHKIDDFLYKIKCQFPYIYHNIYLNNLTEPLKSISAQVQQLSKKSLKLFNPDLYNKMYYYQYEIFDDYIIYKRKDSSVFNLNNTKDFFLLPIGKNASYDILLWNIDIGGISLGVCSDTLNFTGIYINYFGDNCYHLDYFVNGTYTVTGRTCLSQYELYSLRLNFSSSYFNITSEAEEYPLFAEKMVGKTFTDICASIYNNVSLMKIKFYPKKTS